MTGMLTALVVFLTVAGIVAALRSDDQAISPMADQPNRQPPPTARDLHAVTGSLSRAYVPSWT